MNSIIDLLKSHRSIRKFTNQPIEEALLRELVRAGQSAATSSFVQSTSVIRVTNPDVRTKLSTLSGNQPYIQNCAEFLVFCADLKRNELLCKKQGVEAVSGFTEHLLIASIDTALFAQNLVTAAESQGLGICYIGGIRNDPQSVSELLEVPDLVCPLFGLCLGYPAQAPETKPRLPVDVVLHQEKYSLDNGEQLMDDYDQLVSEYYQTRTSGKKDTRWSEQMMQFFGKESRPHILPFLQSKGFLKK